MKLHCVAERTQKSRRKRGKETVQRKAAACVGEKSKLFVTLTAGTRTGIEIHIEKQIERRKQRFDRTRTDWTGSCDSAASRGEIRPTHLGLS